jgi:phosphoserine/homoserine phosphotransferase
VSFRKSGSIAPWTGIAELRRTARDEPDYDKLMRGHSPFLTPRLGCRHQGIDGCSRSTVHAFLEWLRNRVQVIILSDTFAEFAAPLMRKLGWPTLFCNSLEVEGSGRVAGYRLRIPDGKRKAVDALRSIAFRIVAAGDSYNDTTMLAAADAGILFRPPANVVADFPQFPVTTTYDELRAAFTRETAGAIRA